MRIEYKSISNHNRPRSDSHEHDEERQAGNAAHAETTVRSSFESWASSRRREKDAKNSRPKTVHYETITLGDCVFRHPEPKKIKRTTIRAIGMWNLSVLAISTLIIIGAMGFLAYLWDNGQKNLITASRLWHFLATKEWVTQTVTIVALVLRSAVLLQAAVATSMVAALALERGGITLSQTMTVSVMRSLNTSPHALLRAFTSSHGSRLISSRLAGLATTIALISLVTTTLQFTSTILISDITSSTIWGNQYNNTMRNGHMSGLPDSFVQDSPWLSSPASWPTFAEYSEPGIQKDGVVDTGMTMRAFLPFDSPQERMMLGTFKGNATVLDNRVTCVRPNFENAELLEAFLNQYTAQPKLTHLLAGNVSHDVSIASLEEFTLKGEFNCTFNKELHNEMMTKCRTTLLPEKLEVIGGKQGELFLQVNASDPSCCEPTVRSIETRPIDRATCEGKACMPERVTKEGYWTVLQFPPVGGLTRGISIRATLCYASVNTDGTSEVEMHSLQSRTEPTLDDVSMSDSRFQSILHQLGVDPSATHDDRGILTLEPRLIKNNGSKNWRYEETAGDYEFIYYPQDIVPSYYTELNISETLNFCPFCTESPAFPVHRFHRSLFQAALEETADVAKAYQMVIFTLSQMAYLSHLGEFDAMPTVVQRKFLRSQVPRSWSGFGAVMVLLSVHLSGVLGVTFFFSRGTKFSMLGELWQSVAQVCVGEAAEIVNLKSTTTARDKDIRKQDYKGGDGVLLLLPMEEGGSSVVRRSNRKEIIDS